MVNYCEKLLLLLLHCWGLWTASKFWFDRGTAIRAGECCCGSPYNVAESVFGTNINFCIKSDQGFCLCRKPAENYSRVCLLWLLL